MFVRVIHRDVWQRGGVALGVLAAAAIMLHWPQAMANGVSRGLSVCSTVIIPTLYPFMILAGLITESPLCRRPGRVSAGLTRALFGLPGCCGPAILLSLIGGYPAGALAIGRLQAQRQITAAQARRMTRFCVNGGPGFVISTVGAGLMGSTKAGLLLFLAHAGTSIAMGIASAQGQRQEDRQPPAPALPPPRSVADTVRESCMSLLAMCGFVLLASAILSLSEGIGVPGALQGLTRFPAAAWSAAGAALLEVSCGCIALAGTGDSAPFWLCLCMSWGGLSVQGQLAAALPGLRIPDAGFWCARLIHGAVSGAVAMLLFHYIPADLPSVSAMTGQDAAIPFSVSVQASLAMLAMSFITMLVFSAKRTGNAT